MTVTPRAPLARPRRKGLRATGWFFVGIAGLLVVVQALAVVGAFEQRDTTDLVQVTAVVLAMAAGSALLGRHLILESARRHHHHHHRVARLAAACVCFAVSALCAAGTVSLVIIWATKGLDDPLGLVYPASSSVAVGQVGRVLLKNSRQPAPADDEDEDDDLPVPGQVLYREACSDVNPVLILVMLALLGFGIWLMVALAGPMGRPGPQGFLVMVPVLPGLWLVFLLQYLPYGIVVTDSYVQLGVRGVPRVGRIWLRARVPLEGVRHWDVVSSREFRQLRAADGSRFRRWSAGDMVGFVMGARHVLRISADPELVRERFPEFIMASMYDVSSAAGAGLDQDGTLRIGTRRPRALESALATLLPGTRVSAQD